MYHGRISVEKTEIIEMFKRCVASVDLPFVLVLLTHAQSCSAADFAGETVPNMRAVRIGWDGGNHCMDRSVVLPGWREALRG